jgi:hypothetical protein
MVHDVSRFEDTTCVSSEASCTICVSQLVQHLCVIAGDTGYIYST